MDLHLIGADIVGRRRTGLGKYLLAVQYLYRLKVSIFKNQYIKQVGFDIPAFHHLSVRA